MFCYVFPFELRESAWAVGSCSISQSAGGINQIVLFKTLRQSGPNTLYISEVSNEMAATANRRLGLRTRPSDCRRGGRLKIMNRACRPEISIKNGSRLGVGSARAPYNSSERLRPYVIFAVEAQYCKGHRTTSSSRLFSPLSRLLL